MSEAGGEVESLTADMALAAAADSLKLGEPPAPAAHPDRGEKCKIDILLKATGNAPIMKKKKWAVDCEKHIGWIQEFVKKYLKLEPEERLFLYVNQTFAPSPEQLVRNLYECFGSDGKLVLHYCTTQAWG